MARLLIEVSVLGSQKTAGDSTAAETLRKFAANTGYAGNLASNQAVLDHCAQKLVDYVVAVANRQERAEAAAAVTEHVWS